MKFFLSFIPICMLFSCSGKNKIPSGIIPSKEMSAIMWDILSAQSLANEIARKDSSLNVDAETKTLTQKVFEIHKITPSSFDKSYDWYSSHPNILRLMFDSLYSQKQRENDLLLREKYSPVKKDSLIAKINKKMNKVYQDADSSLYDIEDESTIMLGGFGLCGIPENVLAPW